jgi:hypothetical protein
MKEKLAMCTSEHYFQISLPLGCWKPVCKRKRTIWKRSLKKYQTRIDSALAAVAIGLMFLTGIWLFLVQLAEHIR